MYTATGVIIVQNRVSGRLVMYIPGNSSPLHGFRDITSLRVWFTRQCKDGRKKKALEGQFKAVDTGGGKHHYDLSSVLAELSVYPLSIGVIPFYDPQAEINLGVSLTVSPFQHFQKNLVTRLQSDGQRLIHSRHDYNVDVAAQVLSTAITVTGFVAMALPSLWIPLAAMSVAMVGLGADEVINGPLDEQSKGRDRIIFGVLNALLPAAAEAGSTLGAADEAGQKISAATAEERAAAKAEAARAKAEVAAEREEQANESEQERIARLDREERQRQARDTVNKGKLDSVRAFGIEPEGLRSLAPERRIALARFEYKGQPDPSGAWTVDDFGAVHATVDQETGAVTYLARVHARLYRVERDEVVRQYRIVSPGDPATKGPYLKQLKGYLSDIDLKLGLRGGESVVELPIPAEVQGVPPDIVLARGQDAPTTIQIPMDGIEVRPSLDIEPVDQYFVKIKGREVLVRYDADVGCWTDNGAQRYWLDNRGRWKSGSLDEFNRAKPGLTTSVEFEIYQFPLLPGLPLETEAVEQAVHHIWLGEELPNARLIGTIKANLRTNPEFDFTLHIDIESNEVLEELMPKARLQAEFAEFPNMKISNLEDEAFFADFLSDKHSGEPFHYFRRGKGRNLAAASDVLRYRMMPEYGGIYMDCDDVMGASFKGQELKAGSSDVLVGGPVTSPRTSFHGPNNSHFATRPGNPVFREIQHELHSRFVAEREALDKLATSGRETVNGVNPYMSKIFEVTGPRLFLDMLKKFRPDYAVLLDDTFKIKPGIRSFIYLEYLDEVRDFYVPFARRLKISAGAENSWV